MDMLYQVKQNTEDIIELKKDLLNTKEELKNVKADLQYANNIIKQYVNTSVKTRITELPYKGED